MSMANGQKNKMYYLTNDDREHLKYLLRYWHCAECGGQLVSFYDLKKHTPYLQCKTNPRHEGIAKEYQGPYTENIPTRRETMAEQYGEHKTQALAKYEGVVSLTKGMASEILEAIWPEAPAAEKARAALLCATQQLNPLMKHVFLIPFNKGKANESWATVLGISAKRLMASRRGSFGYVDDTPRVMVEDEQLKRFGMVKKGKLVVIVKLRDPQTGSEAVGYGDWPLKKTIWRDGKRVEVDNEPYGSDKGNDMFNMAAIRAESQALNRLRPGDMPEGVIVMDEAIAESAAQQGIEENTIEGEYTEERTPSAPKKKPKPKAKAGPEPQPEVAPEQPLQQEESESQSEPQIEPERGRMSRPARDPASVTTIAELFRACHADFGMQPNQVTKELGYTSQGDISETPKECYAKIVALRCD